MIREVAASAVIGVLVLLAGCSLSEGPTYAEVRQETLDAMDEVVSLIPSHGRIERTPEYTPFSCSDSLLPSSGRGAFFTGHWNVAVADDFDIDGFIDRMPQVLPEWSEEDLGVPVKEPYIYLVRKTPRMTLSLQESELDGEKAIELLAMSRCGVEEPAS
ncbi:hypothetical protein D8Y23_07040 [Microbacterium enclense]|uniref:Lipoprotein n=1 Tax=Microbacterium enclense TaxID=993073 RepID=A0A3S3L9H0_9MICO|nr:hypothetical protein [Microbacterium enclense]RWR19726.1 hypothetical protein D8Y23_07040 [Microbacterium enclense]